MATKSSSHSLSSSIDLQSGFCSQTKTYHSLRPHLPLPPRSLSLSITDFTLSLLRRNSPSSPPTSSALIDAASGHRTPYAELPALVGNLATSLHRRLGLGRGDSAFVLSPNSSRVPVLYLALFSLGVVVSSSNPISAAAEVSRQIELCRPAVAFVSGGVSEEIVSLFGRTVRLHEEEFESMMTARWEETVRIEVGQDDTAVILYSSAVFQKIDESQKLSHRNDVSKTECSRPRPRGSVNAVGGVGDFTRTCSQLEVLDSCAIVVAPVELENLLQTHPDIVDAAVVPYPDEEAGQMPMAFIVKRPESTIDESDIKDFVARQVAPYKKIRRVSFVGSLPKNAPGKVLRKELIKLALLGVSSKL